MGSAHAPRQELAMMQASNLNSVSRFSIRRASRQMQWRRRARRSDSRGHAAGSVIVRACVTGNAGVSDAPRRGRHARVSRDDGSAPCGTAARAEADGQRLPALRSDRAPLSERGRTPGRGRSQSPGSLSQRGQHRCCAPHADSKPFARWRQGMVDLGPLDNSELTTAQSSSPALGLSGWRRWRRDPGESGALHCPDPARPRPWIKTSSVV